jgi:hypothetical protein
MSDHKNNVVPLPKADGVGYKNPPAHSRFKRGQSGNPSGRPKGSQNLKTLFNRILKEEISLREGGDVRKVSKAEAVLRSVVVGALKGDQRAVATMFRLAEQTGHFAEAANPVTSITRIIVGWTEPSADESHIPRGGEVPAISESNRDGHGGN